MSNIVFLEKSIKVEKNVKNRNNNCESWSPTGLLQVTVMLSKPYSKLILLLVARAVQKEREGARKEGRERKKKKE